MKQGWTYKKLGEVCNIDFGTRVVRSRDAGSVYPVYGGGGATFKMDTYNREDCMVISRFGMSEECTRFVKGKFFLNDSGLTLSMKEKCMIQPFMDWQILSLNNTIYSLGRGAAQKNLDTKALAEVTISYPSLSEQERIVSRLDAAFGEIEGLKAKAEAQLSEARTLFQAALTQEMKPKQGWEEKKLGEVAKVIHGKNQKDVLSENGQYPIYGSGGNIMGYANDYLCDAGTTILGRKGSINNPMFIEEPFWNVDTAFGISAKEGSNSKYLYYFIKSIDWQEKNTGTTLPSLTQQVVKDVEIPLPPLPVQQQIVSRLDALSEKVRELEEAQKKVIAECDALKQALLREVFE